MRIPNKEQHWLGVFLMSAVVLIGVAATVTKISDYPSVTVPATNDLFVLASGATNKNIRYDALKSNIVESVAVSNLTVENLTVDNTTTTNITVVQNLVVKGKHTIFTNAALNLSNLPAPSVLVLGTNLNVTNATLSGLTLGDNNTLTATSSTTNFDTAIVTNQLWQVPYALTYSGGTNLTMDLSKAIAYVDLTNTAFFTTPNNVPLSATTSNAAYTVQFRQDATGGRAVTFTNATFKFPGGLVPVVSTNANAITLMSFTLSCFTNGQLLGYILQDIR